MIAGQIIYEILKQHMEVYPEIADIQEADALTLPYAVYKITESDAFTKEDVKHSADVSIFLVTEGYDQAQNLTAIIKRRVYGLRDKIESISLLYPVTVTPVRHTTTFDQEDRKYITEISFTIKFLTYGKDA